MTYAAIMVHVQPEDAAQPVLDCARSLAAAFDATLIGLGCEMIAPLAAGGFAAGVTVELIDVLQAEIDRNNVKAKTRFDAAAAGLAKPAIWKCGTDLPGPATARASRAADLIVAGGPPRKGHVNTFREATAADLVITSGRPVLTVPSAGRPFSAKKVLLAWKDTREARRAMADAMPLLERAEAVLVLDACARDDRADAEIRTADVIAALRRHGVAAEARIIAEPHDDAQEIQRQAVHFGADLIVAGGYGHSRLGEWIFGGVTQALLDQHQFHVLFSH
jgi:nucleotide-binding universal stress UspA family protein